jgi:hypothetical protein
MVDRMRNQSKVALCIFGQMRTFDKCYKYLNNHLLNVIEPDVFIHTWKNRGGTWKSSFNNEPEDGSITYETLDTFYDPIDVKIEEFNNIYYDCLNGVCVPNKVKSLPNYQKGMLPMFYKMHQVNKLKTKREHETGNKYDLVILTRPDLLIAKSISNEVFDNRDKLWVASKKTSWIRDHMIISTSDNIDYYTSIWENLYEYWDSELGDQYGPMGININCTHNTHIGIPERLTHYHIKQSDIEIDTLDFTPRVIRFEDSKNYMRYLLAK